MLKNKHHKKKKRENKSNSSESENDEMEWVEAPAAKVETNSKASDSPKVECERDDWMNEEMFVATLSKDEMRYGRSSRQKKLDALMKEREKSDAIQNERELNPYLKNNGSGLPYENASVENLALPSTSVGDGGYSYLKKAYYRIQEQAQQEGRSMEEIAVERWGSLDKLKSLIDDAEKRMNENSRNKYDTNKNERSDRRDKKSLDFCKPREKRSPSNSPEKSYQYQKPRHSSSRDKRLGHYSSSDQKRHRKYDKDYKYDSDDDDRKTHNTEDDRKKHPKEYRGKYTRDNEKEMSAEEDDRDIFVWDRKHSFRDESDQHKKSKSYLSHDDKASKSRHERSPKLSFGTENSKKDIPAWKKIKPVDERENSRKQNDEYAPKWKKASTSPKRKGAMEESSPQTESTSEALPTVMSEDDLNKLAAKCTKAELFGDTALASKLKKQLEEAREVLKSGGRMNTSQRGQEKVMLTKLDSSGQERPLHYSRDVSQSQTKQSKKQSQKFFDDGSRYSLKQMFEREKMTTADDNLEMFMEVAAKCQDAEDDNETSGISKKASNQMSHHLQEEKDVGRAIQQHQKRVSALEKCCYCLDQPNMKRHLIIQKFNKVYLSIPDFISLVEGHCLIVPKRHVASFLALDEEEWREVEELKRKLRNLFQGESKNIIILETSRSFKYYPHAYLEVIPVPDDISDCAPIYFKKAILESESEWANNVKLIDLNKKNLRHSVPKNLPYFWVEFDPKVHSGFAHVIEDEKNFERNFGKEVIGGMLDIDYNHLFKNRKEDPTKKSKETMKFIKMWESFYEKNS